MMAVFHSPLPGHGSPGRSWSLNIDAYWNLLKTVQELQGTLILDNNHFLAPNSRCIPVLRRTHQFHRGHSVEWSVLGVMVEETCWNSVGQVEVASSILNSGAETDFLSSEVIWITTCVEHYWCESWSDPRQHSPHPIQWWVYPSCECEGCGGSTMGLVAV